MTTEMTTSPLPGPGAAPAGAERRSLERVRARLAEQAEHLDLLDVAYRVVDSPLGPLLLAATPAGLVRVAFAAEGHDVVLAQLASATSPRVLAEPRRLEEAARQLDEYFERRRRHFDLPLDLRLARGFRLTVLQRLRQVGYGRTVSYAQLAALAERPRAVRAAGTACATNPIPLVIPCHRVVRSDGSVGRYGGGEGAKVMLLALERNEA